MSFFVWFLWLAWLLVVTLVRFVVVYACCLCGGSVGFQVFGGVLSMMPFSDWASLSVLGCLP